MEPSPTAFKSRTQSSPPRNRLHWADVFNWAERREDQMGQQLSREIAANPEAVWEVVSDITHIGEWSTETIRCEWDEGQEPGLDATFMGYYRYDKVEWFNQAVITEWVPDERLTWDVRLLGPMADRFGTDPVTR